MHGPVKFKIQSATKFGRYLGCASYRTRTRMYGRVSFQNRVETPVGQNTMQPMEKRRNEDKCKI